MKPSRQISHVLADVMKKSAEKSLEPKRIVAALGGRDGDAFMNSIRQKYADAVLHVIKKHKQSIISDYVIDIVEIVQPVIDKEFKSKDVQAISKLISSPAFLNLISNDAFLNACYEAKDRMNSKVLDIVNGDEVHDIVKNAAKDVLDDMTRSFGFGDEQTP